MGADPTAELVNLLERYGRALNLTGAKDRVALIAHIEEAEACARLALNIVPEPENAVWVDVGSGGGLPGLVVGLRWPGAVVLVEPRSKRAAFLRFAAASLGLSRTRVIQDRVERAGVVGDVVSARAVFSPERWGVVAREVLSPGGICVFHLGADAELPLGWVERGRARSRRWDVVAAVPVG